MNSRCAKMDCHLENTEFSVLGFFKHRSYDDWMEQLFKHEGICVWTDEEYAFMSGARKAWPGGCTATSETVTVDGVLTTLYYDIRPRHGGRIAIGLYTDPQCVTEYPKVDTEYLENVVGNIFLNAGSGHSGDNYNYDFSSDTLEESMERWDSAFGVWNYCHPCVAHDLENTSGEKYLDDDYYYYNGRQRKLGGEYSGKGDVFECYDDAGYTNVNQVSCLEWLSLVVESVKNDTVPSH